MAEEHYIDAGQRRLVASIMAYGQTGRVTPADTVGANALAELVQDLLSQGKSAEFIDGALSTITVAAFNTRFLIRQGLPEPEPLAASVSEEEFQNKLQYIIGNAITGVTDEIFYDGRVSTAQKLGEPETPGLEVTLRNEERFHIVIEKTRTAGDIQRDRFIDEALSKPQIGDMSVPTRLKEKGYSRNAIQQILSLCEPSALAKEVVPDDVLKDALYKLLKTIVGMAKIHAGTKTALRLMELEPHDLTRLQKDTE